MAFKIAQNTGWTFSDLSSLRATVLLQMILPNYDTLPFIQPEGSLIFLTTDNNVYISDGTTWSSVGPESNILASILSLSTRFNFICGKYK